jgi:hypothetical protein
MCRNIKPLSNFEPPASQQEIHDATLQYVRKIAGSTKPSEANKALYDKAVAEIARSTGELLANIVTKSPPKNREIEAAKKIAKNKLQLAAS